MKKRAFAVLLCTVVAVAMLMGCGTAPDSGGADGEAEEAADNVGDAPTEIETVEQRTVYVSPQWVNSAMSGEQEGYADVIVAEVGYGDVKDCESYNAGHVPGALYVDNCEVEDATGSEEGAYNLLEADVVVENMLKHGITKDTKIVLYGADPAGVGRQAYAYLWAGVADVKILNGGIDAWTGAGYDTEKDVNKGTAADDFGAEAPVHPEFWVSIEDAKDRVENDENFKLVSIRSEEEWLGKTSGYNYMDKAGEPKGAVWGKGAETAFDVAMFVNEDGTVKDLAGLEKVWEGCGFTLDNHLSFYCGTGWRATVPFLVLYENGYDDISVYDGGWYEWLMHEDYPVQVGDPASDDCEYTTVGELPTGKAAE